jgi:hypothetical protein
MSSSWISFQKIIVLKNIIQLGGENETRLCFTKIYWLHLNAITSFDLWMSKEAHGIFSFVIYFM